MFEKVKAFFKKATDTYSDDERRDKRKLLKIQKKAKQAHENNIMAAILRGSAIREWDWLVVNYPDMLPLIMMYIKRNDDYTFVEAFESVDSGIYLEYKQQEM